MRSVTTGIKSHARAAFNTVLICLPFRNAGTLVG